VRARRHDTSRGVAFATRNEALVEDITTQSRTALTRVERLAGTLEVPLCPALHIEMMKFAGLRRDRAAKQQAGSSSGLLTSDPRHQSAVGNY
jgi:hypothetical protein